MHEVEFVSTWRIRMKLMWISDSPLPVHWFGNVTSAVVPRTRCAKDECVHVVDCHRAGARPRKWGGPLCSTGARWVAERPSVRWSSNRKSWLSRDATSAGALPARRAADTGIRCDAARSGWSSSVVRLKPEDFGRPDYRQYAPARLACGLNPCPARTDSRVGRRGGAAGTPLNGFFAPATSRAFPWRSAQAEESRVVLP